MTCEYDELQTLIADLQLALAHFQEVCANSSARKAASELSLMLRDSDIKDAENVARKVQIEFDSPHTRVTDMPGQTSEILDGIRRVSLARKALGNYFVVQRSR